jgi:DNA-binding transcriptional LysR family regulator
MTDFRSLETFTWVANLRSFHGAAKKLNTTQPAVSMRIAQLEKELGAPLLVRDRRNVSLTEKGQLLLRYADKLIRDRAEMVEVIGDQLATRGIVRLGVSEGIVHTWLPVLIEQVHAAYPYLELEIEVDSSPRLHDRLATNDLDLALLLSRQGRSDTTEQALSSFPLAFIASTKIKFEKKIVPLREIASWPIITFSRDSRPYIILRELLEKHDLRTTIHASTSLATVMRMALDGMGVAVFQPAALSDAATRSRLRILKTDVALPHLHFIVSLPPKLNNFAAKKVAEIGVRVAKKWKPNATR